jgi:hypothetical protein
MLQAFPFEHYMMKEEMVVNFKNLMTILHSAKNIISISRIIKQLEVWFEVAFFLLEAMSL